MLILALAGLASATDGCAAVSLPDLTAAPAPAIIVLGETPGEDDDLRRAARVVRALRDRARVTLAVEAVHASRATDLTALRATTPDLSAVPTAVDWEDHWAWGYDGYRPLFALGLSDVPGGVDLVAIGQDPAPPAGTRVTSVPAGYADRLAFLAGKELPFTMRDRLARARTWADARMAEQALNAWNGEGYLVIVADRTRVAGPGGVDWQLAQRTQTPLVAATLDWADMDCTDGTLQWRSPAVSVSGPAFGVPR